MMESTCLRDFSPLADLFLELRGWGITLSPEDLSILSEWQRRGWDLDTIQNRMKAMAHDYQQSSKPFPKNLRALDTQLRRLWDR